MKKIVIVSRGGEMDHSLIRLLNEFFPGCEISVVSHEHEDAYRTFSGVELKESLCPWIVEQNSCGTHRATPGSINEVKADRSTCTSILKKEDGYTWQQTETDGS